MHVHFLASMAAAIKVNLGSALSYEYNHCYVTKNNTLVLLFALFKKGEVTIECMSKNRG